MIIALGWIALAILVFLLDGAALSLLWGWFVIPIGFPAISFLQAIGLVIIADLLTHQYIPRNEGEKGRMAAYEVFAPAFAVISGWIVRLFM